MRKPADDNLSAVTRLFAAARRRLRRACSGRLLRYRGLSVIVLWQAPIGPVTTSDGSIGFLFGAGYDEFADLSCEGELLHSRRVAYKVAGLEAEANLGRRFRVLGTAGLLNSNIETYGGPFAGAQLRGDWRYLGLGGGAFVIPPMDEFEVTGMALPSVHLRIGPAGSAHFRADVMPPHVLGIQQIVRLGMGVNATQRDRPAAFFGLAGVGHDEGGVGAAGALDIPFRESFALSIQAHYARGEGMDLPGLVVGARMNFD